MLAWETCLRGEGDHVGIGAGVGLGFRAAAIKLHVQHLVPEPFMRTAVFLLGLESVACAVGSCCMDNYTVAVTGALWNL